MTYLQPLFPLVIGLAIALALSGARARAGDRPEGRARRRLRGAVAAFIFLVSWPPFAALGTWTLERGYEPDPPDLERVEAIVVLGGSVERERPGTPFAVPRDDTYLRARFAAWLARRAPGLPIVACGGKGEPEGPAVAAEMRRILESEGVSADRILLEDRSSSTFENARNAAEILRARGIHRVALCTEASHMLRAERAFRRAGLDVVAAPCAFRARVEPSVASFLPSASAVTRNGATLHEWLGLVWYLARGRA